MKKRLLAMILALCLVIGLLPLTALAAGSNSADFGTITTTQSSGGDSGYTKSYTTANGWTTVNCAIQVGGTTDSNPAFTVIGSDTSHKAVCLNGKTSAPGQLTSPNLTGGISKLTMNYTKMFTDTKLSVTITVTDLASGTAYTHTVAREEDKNTKYVVWTDEWTLDTPISGKFTIDVLNDCPSGLDSNKDRFTILDLSWVSVNGEGGSEPETPTEPEPEPPTETEPETPDVPSVDGGNVVFEFGSNGDATHKDGADTTADAEYTETVGGYTFSFTDGVKTYTGAFDAKGNSCLKLGTGSVAASFSFEVPANVDEVVIAVAKYKNYDTKVNINGVEYALTKNSNDGQYDEISVNTSSTKTVSFATVAGGCRAMINSITFVIPQAGGCDHNYTDATCTTVATCTKCGATQGSTLPHVFGKYDTYVEENGYLVSACANNCGTKNQIKIVTTSEAAEIGAAQANNVYTTELYCVTGTITNIVNTQYGNLYVDDGSGEFYLYGLYTIDGVRYDAMTEQPAVGQVLTAIGAIGNYNGSSPQIKNATMLSCVASECDHEDTEKTENEVPATCTQEGKFTVTCECGAVTYSEVWPTLDHEYVNGVCVGCGVAEPVDAVDPVVGTAYKFGMIQENKNDGLIYYLAGGMDGFYMATTTDVTAALDVYLEETTGGYYMYTVIDGTKTYINMVVSGTHVNGAYEATASTVYTYDAEAQTVIAVVNDTDYWFGTRNDKTYTTVGPCAVSYAGFYCKFYGEAAAPSVPGESAENPLTPEWTWNDAYTEATATVTIPANTTYYFSDYSVNNSFVLTANGEVVTDIIYGMMRSPSTWTITNSTNAAVDYTLKLTVPVGTDSNPAVAVLGNNNADVEEGTWGYYFTYTADFTGELKVEVSGEDNWTFTVNNLTTNKYNDIRWSDDDPVVNPDTIVVRKGDEVQIIVNGYDPANPQETPAANLNVKLTAVELKEIPLMRMALENSLAVQFAVPKAWTSDWTGYYAVVSHRLPDYSVVETTIPASEWETAGNTYWAVVYNNFAAKQMTDKLSVVIYNAQGEAITVPYESTVAQYAKRAFDSAKNDAARAMYVEMLYYGAAAQVRFEYNQDWELATDIIPTWDETDPMTIVANARQDVELTGTGAADAKVNHKGTRLQLEERIDLQMGFGVKFADVARVEVKCNGKNIEVTACPHPENSSMTAVYVDTLNLSECIHDVEIKLYNAAGEVIGSVTDSVRRWATRTVSAGTAAEAELALAQEIVNFSASVDNYMNPK